MDSNKASSQVAAPTRRQVFVRGGLAFGGLVLGSIGASAWIAEEVTHSAEAIHQEPVFKASRNRVYEVLTDAKQFNKVIQLSAAMQAGMSLGTKPIQITREVGGAFSIFGGRIYGRFIELVPNERIVQAWRVADWSPGVYSIAKYELTELPSGTKLVFDHTGFPEGRGQHLAAGWKANYWEPMEKYLLL